MTALVPALALLAACAGTAEPDPSTDPGAVSSANTAWAKIDGSYAAYGDFERAEANCGVKDGLPDVAAAPSSGHAYEACMRKQGWALVAFE